MAAVNTKTMNIPDPWTPVDPLGEALHFLRMNGVFYTRSEFTAPNLTHCSRAISRWSPTVRDID